MIVFFCLVKMLINANKQFFLFKIMKQINKLPIYLNPSTRRDLQKIAWGKTIALGGTFASHIERKFIFIRSNCERGRFKVSLPQAAIFSMSTLGILIYPILRLFQL